MVVVFDALRVNLAWAKDVSAQRAFAPALTVNAQFGPII